MTEQVQDLHVEDLKPENEAPAAPAEKMVPQGVFAAAISAERAKAYERGKREAMAATAPQPQAQAVPQATPGAENGNAGLSVQEQVQKLFQEQMQRQAMNEEQKKREAAHNQMADNFASKIHAAADKYPGLSQKLVALDLDRIPHIVHLANTVDNTADVMNDLHEHPEKLAHFDFLLKTSPQMAFAKMGELSGALKINNAAAQQKSNIEPLDQMTPSNTNVDNGSYGSNVKDFANASWAKV